MSYPNAPHWPKEYDEDWCPGQDLDIDMESCHDCPLISECDELAESDRLDCGD